MVVYFKRMWWTGLERVKGWRPMQRINDTRKERQGHEAPVRMVRTTTRCEEGEVRDRRGRGKNRLDKGAGGCGSAGWCAPQSTEVVEAPRAPTKTSRHSWCLPWCRMHMIPSSRHTPRGSRRASMRPVSGPVPVQLRPPAQRQGGRRAGNRGLSSSIAWACQSCGRFASGWCWIFWDFFQAQVDAVEDFLLFPA